MHRLSRLVGAALALLVPLLAGAQDGATVSGRVTNESGQPLAVASVFLEGMGIGTQTREDGQYTLTVPAARAQGQQARLGIRAIGYKNQFFTITLRGNVTQNFTLEVTRFASAKSWSRAPALRAPPNASARRSPPSSRRTSRGRTR